jgi:hypothetical protein
MEGARLRRGIDKLLPDSQVARLRQSNTERPTAGGVRRQWIERWVQHVGAKRIRHIAHGLEVIGSEAIGCSAIILHRGGRQRRKQRATSCIVARNKTCFAAAWCLASRNKTRAAKIRTFARSEVELAPQIR